MDAIAADGAAGLRIGELARLAGTTARTIRHYEAVGVMAEPARDASGYRRYGAEQVVRLVRIRRLRQAGLPLERTEESLAGEGPRPGEIGAALEARADELARGIASLRELRARVLELAATGALARPAEAWTAALRRHGVLDEAAELPSAERAAVELVDALHGEGIAGAAAAADAALSAPGGVERLRLLLERFRALSDDAGSAEGDALATELAATLPRPAQPPEPVDAATIERLLGARLSGGQRRCLQALRRLLAERDG